eukprot:2368349-Pleurochrysis_carterae.AAC.1
MRAALLRRPHVCGQRSPPHPLLPEQVERGPIHPLHLRTASFSASKKSPGRRQPWRPLNQQHRRPRARPGPDSTGELRGKRALAAFAPGTMVRRLLPEPPSERAFRKSASICGAGRQPRLRSVRPYLPHHHL